MHVLHTAPAKDFTGPVTDFFAKPLKTFVVHQIRSSETRSLIKIHPVEGSVHLKSRGPGQLPFRPALPPTQVVHS